MEKTQLTKTEDRKLKMSDTNPQLKTVDEVFRKGRKHWFHLPKSRKL